MPKAAKIAIIVVAVLAVLFCVGSYVLDRYLLGQTYARYTPDEGRAQVMLTDADVAASHPYEDVEFKLNGYTLRGHVYGADNTRGFIIFRHGIFSQHQDYLALITALVDRGWRVFAYDAIGCGESDGDSVLGFAQSPLDVRAAVQFVEENNLADGLPVMLLGHSWGGYGVAGSLDFPEVQRCVTAVVSMSGFDEPSGIIMESAASQMGPIAATQRPFIDFVGWQDFGEDANRSASRAIAGSGVPTLVIHGTDDAVVSYATASIMSKLQGATPSNVTLITKSEAGRNGHNTYFYSPESQAYLSECSANPDMIPTMDKFRANTADPILIDEIDGFFIRAINNSEVR